MIAGLDRMPFAVAQALFDMHELRVTAVVLQHSLSITINTVRTMTIFLGGPEELQRVEEIQNIQNATTRPEV